MAAVRCVFLVILLGVSAPLAAAEPVSNGIVTEPSTETLTETPEGAAEPKEKTIEYRRWLAPKNRIGYWPYGESAYYVPLTLQEWTELLDKASWQQQSAKTPPFSRIVLRGTLENLQLVDGEGFLELESEHIGTDENGPNSMAQNGERSIPLEPWGLWTSVSGADRMTTIFRASDGGLRLHLPANEAAESELPRPMRFPFQWSLRSRPDLRIGLQFDFELPPCLSTELHLDLPAMLLPSCGVGLVTEISEPTQERTDRRQWRILAGRHSRFGVTISPGGKAPTARCQVAIQPLRYTIEPEGLNVSATLKFEKADAKVDELIFDIEEPLRVTGISYGDQSLGWTRLGASENGDGSRIHVDLSDFSDRRTDEMTILASASLSESRPWSLPRIRVVSENVFWKETRCGLHVLQPFLVRNIDLDNAVQVRPRSPVDYSDRDVYVYQFFEDDARITVDFEEYSPEVTTAGAVQFLWGNNEVRGNIVLDCGIPEGDVYTLRFPITPRWTIDSVKSLYWTTETQKTPVGDEVLSWDILEDGAVNSADASTQWLSIQLKSPIRPKKSLQIAVSARFQPENQTEFRLHDFSPLQLPPGPLSPGKEATHHIAIQQTSSQFQLQCRSPGPSRSSPDDAAGLRQMQRYIEDASGNVYAMDARNRDLRFTLERLKPTYSSQLSGIATVRDKELHLAFDMQCQPIDSSVDRIYVHFTSAPMSTPASAPTSDSSSAETNGETTWTWTGLTEAVKPLQIRRLPPTELEELFPSASSRGLLDDFPHEESWEIRLAVPQSGPFEIRATAVIPFTDSIAIPLASLPFASTQRGEIAIQSPRQFPYRIVNTRLKSVPVTPTKWFRYEETRAVFRYNPRKEMHRSLQSPLSLQRLAPEEMPPSAWVWSLRLDTQYEPDGLVRNSAVFLLENRGKDKLRIRLPDGIGIEDVHAVWLDDQREIWHPEVETPSDRFYTPSRRSGESSLTASPAAPSPPGRLVVVALPEGSRFVTIALEYTSRDKALVRQRKLSPRYPTVDVPILSGGWTSWFPPEFDVSLPSHTTTVSQGASWRLSEAMSHLFRGGSRGGRFDPLSRADWERFFKGDRRRREAEAGVRVFFDWIAAKQQRIEEEKDVENDFLHEKSPLRGGRFIEDGKLKWLDLLGDERTLTEMLAKLPQEDAKGIDVTVLIDRKALAIQGVFPNTAVSESTSIKRRGVEMFEQAGLVLLVSTRIRPDKIREFTFYITSPLVLALHRHLDSETIGPCIRYIPETVDLGASRAGGESSSDLLTPHWVPVSRWLSDPHALALPWSISSQINRLSSVTPDWNAFEMAQGPDNLLYVVHRKTFAAYHWLAFLAVVVLTLRKPFSHPAVLILLMVLFEILTRLVAPCQAGVPSGAFLGALVSLGFCLIRLRTNATPRLKRRVRTPSVEIPTRYDAGRTEPDSSDSSGKTRIPLVFIGFVVSWSFIAFVHAETLPPRPANPPPESEPVAPATKEAYRVFFSIDEDRQLLGDVYAPAELFELLMERAESVRSEPRRLWNIIKAEYHGSITYNPVTQKLELGNDFSLLLDIRLESENAVISLPALPVLQDRATWDLRPIQSTLRTQDADRNQTLVFHIENEPKGRHQLRLPLAPTKIVRENGLNRIELNIPRVADATLRLKTPPEAPPLTIVESFGAVTPNSATSPEFIARIGPVDKLSFSWPEEPDREEATTVEVDQRFDLLARPTQLEIRATLSFRINGGRIRHLNLLTDPRWRLSGQFRCSEHSIETEEKPVYLSGTEGLPSVRNEVFQLSFKEPITGSLTLNAGFVLRDFSGVGKVRLPRFEALNTQIVKSMLTVSADPNIEIDCPAAGLLHGYRPGWNSVAATKTGTETVTKNDTVAVPEIVSLPVKEETPLAEYDLTRTDPGWILGVRTRRQAPEMRLTQTVRFDCGDSSLLCRADFFSTGDVFQQRLFVPENLRVDSIEVRDASDKIVEVRRSETGRTPTGSALCVFFKQPISGRYSMTLRGGFETRSDLFETSPPTPLTARIPMPVFENVRPGEQVLNVFRTASTMVELRTGGTAWTVSETAPVLPDTLRDAFVCGSWKKTPEPTDNDENDDGNNGGTPEFSLLPNRPAVRGTQITSLKRHAADTWNVTFDFLWDIVDGELDTIRLRWDEQCAVLAVEPAIPFHMEQDEGRPILVLTPAAPLSGSRHFRLRSALNTSGMSISLPHVGPELGKSRRYDTESYLVLPRYDIDEQIPWNLSMLEEPDEETVQHLEASIARPLAGNATPTASAEGAERPLFFRVLTEDFSATISRQNARSMVGLYDASFVVKSDGVVFGIATIDLKSRGQDSFILLMPTGYELIQVNCSGIASKGTRLPPGDRWKIDLWSSDYPQRVRIIFRGALTAVGEKGDAVRLDDQPRHCGIALPVLEGVSVQKTIWVISFDAVRGKAFVPLDVSTIREKEFGQSSFSSPEILGEQVTELGRHVPASGPEAMQTLFKFNMLRLYNIRTILDLVTLPGSSRPDELRRWFASWSDEWYGINRLLDYLGRQYSETLQPGKHLFLLDLQGASFEDAGFGAAELYLEANNIAQPLQALIFGYKELVTKNFGPEVEDEPRRPNSLSANSMLYWRDRLTDDSAYLFGAGSGQIREIRLKSVPNAHRFSERLLEHLFPWILIPLLIPLFSRKLPFAEWFCQFPHFWGAAVGVLLWSLFPPGYIGIAVLALTLLSWLWPVWPKHTEFQEHPVAPGHGS